MSPRIHPDIDPPDPAVRVATAAIEKLLEEDAGSGSVPAALACAALDAARPIWAAQLAIAVEDASKGDGDDAERIWYDVAEFIRAREERP